MRAEVLDLPLIIRNSIDSDLNRHRILSPLRPHGTSSETRYNNKTGAEKHKSVGGARPKIEGDSYWGLIRSDPGDIEGGALVR